MRASWRARRIRFGSARLGRLGSARSSARLGRDSAQLGSSSARIGSVRFGSVRFGSVRFGSVRFGSANNCGSFRYVKSFRNFFLWNPVSRNGRQHSGRISRPPSWVGHCRSECLIGNAFEGSKSVVVLMKQLGLIQGQIPLAIAYKYVAVKLPSFLGQVVAGPERVPNRWSC